MRLIGLAVLAAAGVLGANTAPRAADEGFRLAFPLACQIGKGCEVQNYVDRDPGPESLDYHCGHRTYDKHDGVDIRLLDMAAQRAGVDVLAAAPGRVARLRDGVPDISIRAPGAPSVAGRECGNAVVIDHGGGWETQYCHLAKGSVRVKPGDAVGAGQPIARVGLSGETEFPHLHLSVRHNGQMVDPFAPGAVAPGACPAQPSLWDAAATRMLGYKHGAVVNMGFGPERATLEAVEGGDVASIGADPPALVAYVRFIGLEVTDVIELRLIGPDGAVLLSYSEPPLNHDKALWLSQIGRKRPATGWPHGRYTAEAAVRRNGAVALQQRWQVTL